MTGVRSKASKNLQVKSASETQVTIATVHTQKLTQPAAHMSDSVVGLSLLMSSSGLIQRKGRIGPTEAVKVTTDGIAAMILPKLKSAIFAMPFLSTSILS